MKEKERKEVAAFFELLDEWSRAEDAELFMRARHWGLLKRKRRTALGAVSPGPLGAMGGGKRDAWLPFT